MSDWRNQPITSKQKEYIADIIEFSAFCPPPFTGTTRGEASDYIDKYGKELHDDPNGHGFGY